MRVIISSFIVILVACFSYGKVTKEEAAYILKNHKEKGFYFEGEVSLDTFKVVLDFPAGSEKVFVTFADGRVGRVVSFYSTVVVLDTRPSYELLEYLLRANNFDESLGFFYLYYDVSLDKWFVDYCVRIREEDLTKFSLISLVKIVGLYSVSARKRLLEVY